MEHLRQEYLEMKALIDASEASSTQMIKEEEKRVSSKFNTIYQILLKKKNEIQTVKEEIELALKKGDEFQFLEVGVFCVFFKDFIYLFLEREGEGGRTRGRETLMCKRGIDRLPLTCAPTGDQSHNPGAFPDWESNANLPLCGMAPNQLSLTGQGWRWVLMRTLLNTLPA